MGEGGTPDTWAGYLSSISAEKTIAFDDTLSPEIYKRPEQYASGWSQASATQRAAAQTCFLKQPLPMRQGSRLRAEKFVFPQREKRTVDFQDPEVKKLSGASCQICRTWPNVCLDNGMEDFRPRKALDSTVLKTLFALTPLASPTQREICHIHTSDSSGHVTLSFVDAQEVIAKGWGERHRLSGSDWIHLGYTMVCVPRTVEETEVLSQIFQAGADYMCSG